MAERVTFTLRAAALARQLKEQHGALIFHQSGGCCEGSAPMCLRLCDFHTGGSDVLLGTVEGCPVYVNGAQYEAWGKPRILIDVVPSSSDSFSLETQGGVRFITRSQPLEEAAAAEMERRSALDTLEALGLNVNPRLSSTLGTRVVISGKMENGCRRIDVVPPIYGQTDATVVLTRVRDRLREIFCETDVVAFRVTVWVNRKEYAIVDADLLVRPPSSAPAYR